MRVGVHLPLADLGQGIPDLPSLRAYVRTAAAGGFATVAANDHLVWRRPWLDGPTALAAVVGEVGDLALATSVALPTVRHPAVLAKTLSSLAVLAEGRRVIAGVGPGSSAEDHRLVGVPFEERWARFDEAVPAIRAMLRGEPVPQGKAYDLGDVRLAPLPARPPELWCGSWGSDTRLRRLVAVADGWLASGYNTTPEGFAEARARIDGHLTAVGRAPSSFPDLVATLWLWVTDDVAAAEGLLRDVLGPVLQRDPDELGRRLPVGSPEHVAGLLQRYAEAGAHEVLLWPVRDPIHQLERVSAEILPLLAVGSTRGART
jgi:alkanesulfonate monooxygenase SsuD/methylene tetrahydromethanopterin reductase-like flavin-dependent oxidoreductase (luciferase family)